MVEWLEDGLQIEEWMEMYEQGILVPGSDRICNVCAKKKTVRIGSKIYVYAGGDVTVATVRGIHWGGNRWFSQDDKFYLDIDVPGETEDGNVITKRCHTWANWIVIDTETLICQACGENNTQRFDDLLVQNWRREPDIRPLVCQACANPLCTVPECAT